MHDSAQERRRSRSVSAAPKALAHDGGDPARQRFSGGLVRCGGLHLDLDDRERGAVAEHDAVLCLDAGQAIVDLRLGQAVRAQDDLMAPALDAVQDRRQHRALEHRRHLARDAGQERGVALAERDRKARRGTLRVRQDGGAARKIRLLFVARRHRQVEALEARADRRERRGVALEGHGEHARDALGRDVVRGRPEPARAHQHVALTAEAQQRGADRRRVVRHACDLGDDEACARQRLAQPRSVGVHELASGELGANRQYGRGRHRYTM